MSTASTKVDVIAAIRFYIDKIISDSTIGGYKLTKIK